MTEDEEYCTWKISNKCLLDKNIMITLMKNETPSAKEIIQLCIIKACHDSKKAVRTEISKVLETI
jgi:hypothetical protein